MSKKREVPKTISAERLTVLSLKGSPEYRDALNELSELSRIPVSTIVRDAIADWAKTRNLPAPPKV